MKGTVQNGMSVRYEIDTYPYSQWGTIGGTVLEMPQDIKIIDNKPIFEVRCSLDKDFLELKSGYRGFLKKGMSAKAHFIVAKRSLWTSPLMRSDSYATPSTLGIAGRSGVMGRTGACGVGRRRAPIRW